MGKEARDLPSLQELRSWLRDESTAVGPESEPKSPTIRWKSCSACGGSGTNCQECDGIGSIPKISALVDKMEQKAPRGATGQARTQGKYKIDVGGKDALLLFGKYKDTMVSDLPKHYQLWIVTQGTFPEELVDIALMHIHPRLGEFTGDQLESLAGILGIEYDGPRSALQLRIRLHIKRRVSL